MMYSLIMDDDCYVLKVIVMRIIQFFTVFYCCVVITSIDDDIMLEITDFCTVFVLIQNY